ncbi:hypothetical protein C8R43DRAFT_1022648, partial [Mycena crocata]
MLTEIFLWVVEDTRYYLSSFAGTLARSYSLQAAIRLSHVCSLWLHVALSSPIWKRLELLLDIETYTKGIFQTHYFLTRCPRVNLDISIRRGKNGECISLSSIQDVVVGYTSRITSLCLHLDAPAISSFLHLPAGSFPALLTLDLGIDHGSHEDWIAHTTGPSTGFEGVSALAPRLLSCSLTPIHGILHMTAFLECLCRMDPFQIGLDYSRLRELHILAGIPCEAVHELLRRCKSLEKASFCLDIGSGDYPDDDTESANESDYGAQWEDTEGDDEAEEVRDAQGTHVADESDGSQSAENGGDEEDAEDVSSDDEDEGWTEYSPEPCDPHQVWITLPALTHLSVTFEDYDDAEMLFQPLVLPALTNLRIGGAVYCLSSLVDCIQRSRKPHRSGNANIGEPSDKSNPEASPTNPASHLPPPLQSLYFSHMALMQQTDIRELVGRHPALTRLQLYKCRGDFWKAIPREFRKGARVDWWILPA